MIEDSPESPIAGRRDHRRPLLHVSDPLAVFRLVGRLARDPVEVMAKGPSLTWPAAFLLQATAAVLAGALLGALSASAIELAIGALAFPVIAIAASLGIGFFLHTSFAVFARSSVDRRELYGVVALATLPYLALHALASFVPPIDLLGFFLSCLLLIVGLVERFGLPRKIVLRVVAGTFLIFFAAWAWAQFRALPAREASPVFERPKTLDQLESELKEKK
jgi:hypothetical protein